MFFYLEEFGKRLVQTFGRYATFIAEAPVFPLLLLLAYGAFAVVLFYGLYLLTGSLAWISYVIEFFALSVLFFPFFYYFKFKENLFSVKEEEGFIVIVHSRGTEDVGSRNFEEKS